MFDKFIKNDRSYFTIPSSLREFVFVGKESFDDFYYIIDEIEKEGYINSISTEIIKNYIHSIFQISWVDFTQRTGNDCVYKILSMLVDEIYKNTGKDKEYFKNIYLKWIDYIKPYTFQGGYGYSFSTSDLDRHHLCIYPNEFDKIKNIDKDILISCILLKKDIYLSYIAKMEVWGN